MLPHPALPHAIPIHAENVFEFVEFAGVITGAMDGALSARRNRTYHYDLIGVLGFAVITALGGGITRDILIQQGPPLAFLDERYLLLALGAGILALFFGEGAGPRMTRFLWIVDAASVGLFAVAGSTRALHAGLDWLPSLILGIITAVGGGSLRDIVSGRSPRILERGEPYTIAAIVSAAAFLIAMHFGMDPTWATAIGAILGLVLKLLASRFRWRTRALRINSRPDV